MCVCVGVHVYVCLVGTRGNIYKKDQISIIREKGVATFNGLIVNIKHCMFPPPRLGIDSSSPKWVGAWWTGFMAGAVALFLVTIPMSGYARDIPGT